MKELSKVNQIIGAKIKTIRLDRKIVQDDMAAMIGITRVNLINIEKGNNGTSVENLIKIAKILKCNLIDLLPTESEFTPKLIDITQHKKDIAQQKINKLNYRIASLKRVIES